MKTYLSALILFAALFATAAARAEDAKSVKMSFKNADILDVIEAYAKATGEKFIVDPAVRGRISIFIPSSVDREEAFNLLSSALAANGLGLSKQGDVYSVLQARSVQRNYIEVGDQLPPLKPERMFTWVATLKNVPVDAVNRNLRILTSKDGELVPNAETNQLLISDWVSNLYRIQEILKRVDKAVEPPLAKVIEAGRRERERVTRGEAARFNPGAPPPAKKE